VAALVAMSMEEVQVLRAAQNLSAVLLVDLKLGRLMALLLGLERGLLLGLWEPPREIY